MMQPEDQADILLEAIEVLLNHLLYLRNVYPAQIFKKRRIYNTPVFVSIYPPLNVYLGNVLRTARELLRRQELKCLEMIIYRNECEHVENYVFELQSLPCTSGTAVDDQYLLHYEEQLRSTLYKLAERLKPLKKLSHDVKFKVQLHTTQTGFLQLSHDAQYQEFPWLTASPLQPGLANLKLLPLATVKNVGLQMTAHILS